ncbi:MAG: SRPBCC family protein [Acidimicrobiia bacterium]
MPDTFTHTALVAAPKAAVWAALQRAETWKNIGPIEEVWDATHAEDGSLEGYRWSARAAGRTWKGVATTLESVREHRMQLALESPEIHGGITVDIGAGEITVSMDAEPRGPLATIFWGTVRRALQSGLPAQVEAFASGLAISD